MEHELLPCPMCGGEGSGDGKRRWSSNPDTRWLDGTDVLEAFFFNFICVRCGLHTADYQTREQAVAAWNRRVAPCAPGTSAVK